MSQIYCQFPEEDSNYFSAGSRNGGPMSTSTEKGHRKALRVNPTGLFVVEGLIGLCGIQHEFDVAVCPDVLIIIDVMILYILL